MLDRKTWNDFLDTGLLWFVNRLLHVFGWVIVIKVDYANGEILECWPARTKFRGFDQDTEERNFEKVAHYLKDTSAILYSEAGYEEEDGEKVVSSAAAYDYTDGYSRP